MDGIVVSPEYGPIIKLCNLRDVYLDFSADISFIRKNYYLFITGC